MKSFDSYRPRALFDELIARSLNRGAGATTGAPHLRSMQSSDRLQNDFVLASLPAFAIGVWVGGAGLTASAAEGGAQDWRTALAVMLGSDHWLAEFSLGLLTVLPLLLVAATVSAFWEVLFAGLRRRPVDSGWPMMTWIFVLLLPLNTPLYLVALGMSFGAVMGKHIFGGTGRYVVSPALLGVVFLLFAYPSQFQTPSAVALSFDAVADGNVALSWRSWLAAFLGLEGTAIGAASTLACLLGGVYLALRSAISLRTVGGAIAGLAAAAWIFDQSANDATVWHLAWHWHLVLGYFAFCTVFVATDPTIMPLMPAGRWIYGGLLGVLTVTIRVANPAHPEGTLFAVLLASLCIALIDHCLLRIKLGRRAVRSIGNA